MLQNSKRWRRIWTDAICSFTKTGTLTASRRCTARIAASCPQDSRCRKGPKVQLNDAIYCVETISVRCCHSMCNLRRERRVHTSRFTQLTQVQRITFETIFNAFYRHCKVLVDGRRPGFLFAVVRHDGTEWDLRWSRDRALSLRLSWQGRQGTADRKVSDHNASVCVITSRKTDVVIDTLWIATSSQCYAQISSLLCMSAPYY